MDRISAMAHTSYELTWFKTVDSRISFEVSFRMNMYCDNQADAHVTLTLSFMREINIKSIATLLVTR